MGINIITSSKGLDHKDFFFKVFTSFLWRISSLFDIMNISNSILAVQFYNLLKFFKNVISLAVPLLAAGTDSSS